MKLLSSLITCCFLFLGANRPNDSIVGSWRLQKNGWHGVSMTTCGTPQITFYQSGTGIYEGDKAPGSFKWEVNNDTIRFFSDSEKDKKIFYFDETEYTFETYTKEEVIDLKLTHRATNSWHLLSKENTKQ